MSPIDKKRNFVSINIAVLTISDSRTEQDDISGNFLVERIIDHGHYVYDKKIIKDEISLIKNILLTWATDRNIDAIITSGGTGLTGRDSTPEAIRSIADKNIKS